MLKTNMYIFSAILHYVHRESTHFLGCALSPLYSTHTWILTASLVNLCSVNQTTPATSYIE